MIDTTRCGAGAVLRTLALGLVGTTAATATAQTAKAPVARVAVVKPERATIRRVVEQPGQIEAAETTPIHAKVSGFVRTVAVDIGDRVKAGQVLIELDVPELEAESARAQAAVEQAQADQRQAEATVVVASAQLDSARALVVESQAGIARARADLDRWRAEYARIDQLVRESALTPSLRDETRSKFESAQAAQAESEAQAHSSETAVAEAQAAVEKARADVAAAAARVAVARFELQKAQAMARYTRLVAPYDAVVVRRQVDPGQLTRGGVEDAPLLVVSRIDPVTVVVGVPEVEAGRVEPGDAVTVKVQALAAPPLIGKVSRTSWAIETTNRTLRVEIDVPNPEARLRPGLYGYVSLTSEERPDVLTLPVAALVETPDHAYCVVIANGRATRRTIQPGLSDGTRVEIRSGLTGSETVVAANAATILEGQPLEPLPSAQPTPKP